MPDNNTKNDQSAQEHSDRKSTVRYGQTLSVAEIRDAFNYDPSSGELSWRKPVGRARAGSVCGSPDGRGYLAVGYKYARWRAHRLAWAHWHGEWPDKDIDHIDGNTQNNAINNLRLATKSQNLQNRKLNKDNKTGVRGVTWHKPSSKWQAHITVSGRQIALGRFECIKDAAEARRAAEKKFPGRWRQF